MTNSTRLLLALFFSLTVALPVHAESDSSSLQIYFLDVGQGDAMILNQPGSCAALIDAGPLLNGHRITHALQELGIDTLDVVIITHPHLDHFGGLFDLYPRFSIEQFYDNGASNPAREYFSDYQTIRENLPYRTVAAGDRISCGDISLEVLSPRETIQPGLSLNESSLALMISYSNFRLLQMGDLAGAAESSLLDSVADLNADVIKVGHHGGADATSDRLLDRVQPKLAIISTSENNWIQAPSPKLIDTLKKRNIACRRTDRHGTIQLVVPLHGQFSMVHGLAAEAQ